LWILALAAIFFLCQTAVGAAPATDSAKGPTLGALPPATGPFAVGKVTVHWTDESRVEPLSPSHEPRELMVDIWYPAESSKAVPADYLDAVAYEKAMGADGFQNFFERHPKLSSREYQPKLLPLHLMLVLPGKGPC
jgi:hypothetical protein